jgi:N utilization substance protein B
MLNRRYLRIKVYQALYAHAQSDGGNPAKTEKELLLGIERTYDLYVHLMMLFGEMRQLAEARLAERKLKRMPTTADLAPNRRFVDNPVLVMLSESKRLLQESEKRKTGWIGERDMLQRLYKQIEAGPEYAAYMAADAVTPEMDRGIVLDIFMEHMAQFEPLHDHFEGKSIHWLEDLDLACALVKRSVETLKVAEGDLSLTDLDREHGEEREFVTTLYRDTIGAEKSDEKIIADRASNWEADRIALSDMLLMRMALTEVRSFDLIPVKVTMNEYIEIAKAYSTPKSKNFINGILDKLFAEMKADGSIHKVGRGLLES